MLANAWRIAQKSAPAFEENAPLTFSQTNTLGLMSAMRAIAYSIRLLLEPLSPALLPASEKSWQGDPNVIMSMSVKSHP